MARRPLERELICLDGGRRTTQLMRESLGSTAGVIDLSQILEDIAEGRIDPRSIRVTGREVTCPSCETSAWYGPRGFEGEVLTYWLCKWCGYRWSIAEGEASATLAVPVFHRCTDKHGRLTWHQFEGEPYKEKAWTCDCGTRLTVLSTLRPYPRFSSDPSLMEKPGD